ncbi:MAG TPA: response regulator transcription factor [Pseudolabrys sp.]|nr:response regulator transcription factor [Pseudolabrys sp.]
MSQPGGKPYVAIVDTKSLRRASIASLLEPWADAENLRVTSFTPDQANEALRADKTFRMLIFSVGGETIAENLQQLKVLRALAANTPLVIISDREDPHDVAAAFDTDAQGFLSSGIPSALAFQALTFILNGGSYYPPSAVHQLHNRPETTEIPQGSPTDDSSSKRNGPSTNGGGNGSGPVRAGNDLGCQSVNLTARQREVLKHLRLGESNKMIARRLGMTEGTVKVHIRQMMRKCHATNRTQLALGGPLGIEDLAVDNGSLDEKSAQPNGTGTLTDKFKPAPPGSQSTLPLIGTEPRGRGRIFDKH